MTEPVLEPVAPPSLFVGRVKRWTGILAAFFSAQSAVQLLGIGAGLLFVNFLPVEQFALYTLANSVLAFFTTASDLGSTTSLVYFYRTSSDDPAAFQALQAAVISLRRTAFAVGAVIASIALPAVATVRGLPLRDALFCTAGVLSAVWFQIEASLGVLILRLQHRFGRSYRAEVGGALMRLALAATLVVSGGRMAWLAVLSGACATGLVALLARAPRRPSTHAMPEARRRVVRYLLPSLPSGLYFSIQAPLIVFLSATFGSTRSIAEVGAIGRLGLLVGVFSSLTGVVFLPHLAKLRDEHQFRIRAVQFGFLLLAVGATLFLAAGLAPRMFLTLLGPNYKGLHGELLLVVATSGINLIGGYCVAVNLSRAWNRWETISVIVYALCQAALIAVLPLGTARGVLRFGLASAAIGLMLQMTISIIGFSRPSIVHWKT